MIDRKTHYKPPSKTPNGTIDKRDFRKGMDYFYNVKGENEFVGGEIISMADITLFMGLGFADFTKIEIP